jgi:hypothetical protein
VHVRAAGGRGGVKTKFVDVCTRGFDVTSRHAALNIFAVTNEHFPETFAFFGIEKFGTAFRRQTDYRLKSKMSITGRTIHKHKLQ